MNIKMCCRAMPVVNSGPHWVQDILKTGSTGKNGLFADFHCDPLRKGHIHIPTHSDRLLSTSLEQGVCAVNSEFKDGSMPSLPPSCTVCVCTLWIGSGCLYQCLIAFYKVAPCQALMGSRPALSSVSQPGMIPVTRVPQKFF